MLDFRSSKTLRPIGDSKIWKALYGGKAISRLVGENYGFYGEAGTVYSAARRPKRPVGANNNRRRADLRKAKRLATREEIQKLIKSKESDRL